jgi:hypothetical protein
LVNQKRLTNLLVSLKTMEDGVASVVPLSLFSFPFTHTLFYKNPSPFAHLFPIDDPEHGKQDKAKEQPDANEIGS